MRSEKSSDSYDDAESIDARLRSISVGLCAIEADGAGSVGFSEAGSIGSGEVCLGTSSPKLNCMSAAFEGVTAGCIIIRGGSAGSVCIAGSRGDVRPCGGSFAGSESVVGVNSGAATGGAGV